MKYKDLFYNIESYVDGSELIITKKAEAKELILDILKEEGESGLEDVDIDEIDFEEFMKEWNYFVCLGNEEVYKDGRWVDRLDVMSDSEVARAIRESFLSSWELEDLYDYVFENFIDRDDAVTEWANNYDWD